MIVWYSFIQSINLLWPPSPYITLYTSNTYLMSNMCNSFNHDQHIITFSYSSTSKITQMFSPFIVWFAIHL